MIRKHLKEEDKKKKHKKVFLLLFSSFLLTSKIDIYFILFEALI